jgi:hypothetical protein
MRQSMASTAFRMFDKIIVAALGLITLFYLVIALVQEPKVTIDPEQVKIAVDQIQRKEASFKHQGAPLTVDYLTASVGAFRPDAKAVLPRAYLFTETPGEAPVVTLPDEIRFEVRPEAPAPAPRLLPSPKEWVGSQIRIAESDARLVEAAWVDDRLRIAAKGPAGTARVALVQDGEVKKEIRVRIEAIKIVVQENIGTPAGFVASVNKGQVPMTWRPAPVLNATVRRYVILRGDEEKKPEPYVTIALPEALEPNAQVPATYLNGAEAPSAFWDGQQFIFVDRRLDSGVAYTYQIRAEGVGQSGAKLVGGVGGPAKVVIEELYKLRLFSLSPEAVTIEVTVVHTRENGESVDVAGRFTSLVRGQEVGWTLPRVPVPGQAAAENVDFSTGLQILDILNDQRYIRREDKDAEGNVKRQWEGTRQKVLLISERGRIKVLTPSHTGAP